MRKSLKLLEFVALLCVGAAVYVAVWNCAFEIANSISVAVESSTSVQVTEYAWFGLASGQLFLILLTWFLVRSGNVTFGWPSWRFKNILLLGLFIAFTGLIPLAGLYGVFLALLTLGLLVHFRRQELRGKSNSDE